MSIAVRIKVSDTGVLAALSRLALDPDDKADLLDEIGINLVENNRLRFGDQHGPNGEQWEPSLRVQQNGGETLRDTGQLLASITHAVHGDTVEFGTNHPGAAVLHFGATIHAKAGPFLKFKVPGVGWVQKEEVTIPARPFLGISDEDATLVVDIIESFLNSRQ